MKVKYLLEAVRPGVSFVAEGELPFLPVTGMSILVFEDDDFRTVTSVGYDAPEQVCEVFFDPEMAEKNGFGIDFYTDIGWCQELGL